MKKVLLSREAEGDVASCWGVTIRRRVATRCRDLRRDRSPTKNKLLLLWGCRKELLYSVKYLSRRHTDRRRIEWEHLVKKDLYTVKEAKKKRERGRIWEDTRRTDVSIYIYICIYIQITVYRLRKSIGTYELESSNDIISIRHSRTTTFLVGGNLVFFLTWPSRPLGQLRPQLPVKLHLCSPNAMLPTQSGLCFRVGSCH